MTLFLYIFGGKLGITMINCTQKNMEVELVFHKQLFKVISNLKGGYLFRISKY